MDFVKDFMIEQFIEEKTHFIKMKVVWYRFRTSSQYMNSIRGKNKRDDFRYSLFVNIIKKEYPHFYKNHWKYGQCLTGGLKDRNGDLCDFIECDTPPF